MKNMQQDEYGYISGLGVSKYWGVSKNIKSSLGQDPWVVKYADPFVPAGKSNRYRVFVAKEFVLSEKEAAFIAAYFYENQKPFCNHPIKIELLTDKYKFVINTREKSIHRFRLMSLNDQVQPVVTFPLPKKPDFYTTPSMLDDILAVDKKNEEAPVIEGNKIVEQETDYDKGFAAGFALNEIIRNKLGTKGLNSILESIQKRLKD